MDGKTQAAWFFKAKSTEARPLIVSLHTWSGDYNQKDTLSWQCIDRDYHYIHPDFRGKNNTYEACGSPLAIQDIDDAIDYALKHAKVDLNNIHIIGVSGGGYSTLLAYMKTKHKVKSFSAWVPISNLVDWYSESVGRKNKYAKDMAEATNGQTFDEEPYYLDAEEAIKRSPMFMDAPIEERMESKLYIYAGIHDGYTGSVPITHSLNFYNKLVKAFDPNNQEDKIPTNDIIKLLSYRTFSPAKYKPIGGRSVHYKKVYKDKFQVIIFEGGHEMLEEHALEHVEDN